MGVQQTIRPHTPLGVISLCLCYQRVILAVCLGHSVSDVDMDTLSSVCLEGWQANTPCFVNYRVNACTEIEMQKDAGMIPRLAF